MGIRASLMGVLGVALFAWVALFDCYRLDNVDDPWFLSMAWNFAHHGETGDRVFGSPPSDGMHPAAFGRLHIGLVAGVLDRVGWTRTGGWAISSLFMGLAISLWGILVRSLSPVKPLALALPATMLLLEPFFGAAHQARPDALGFLLATGAFLAVVKNSFGIGGFLGVLAFETHPMAAVAALTWSGAWWVARWMGEAGSLGEEARERSGAFPSGAWRGAVGIGGGVLLYLYWHGEHLDVLWASLRASAGAEGGARGGNFLGEYFFRTLYLRHLPELALLLLATFLYLQKKEFRRHPFPGLFVLAVVGMSMIIRRPNFHYAVYAWPAFLWMVLWTAWKGDKLAWALTFFALLLLPQYGILWTRQGGMDFQGDTSRLRASLSGDGEVVVGPPMAWFAFPDREFVSLTWQGSWEERVRSPLQVVEDDAFRRGIPAGLHRALGKGWHRREGPHLSMQGQSLILATWIKSKENPR